MFWLAVQRLVVILILDDFWVAQFWIICVDWFGMPIYFSMPILLLSAPLNPDFGIPNQFGKPNVLGF